MSAGFGQFSFILLIPLLVDELGLGLTSIGVVLSSYSVAIILCSPLWGYLSDRFNRRRPFLIAGYALFALASLLYVHGDTLPELVLFRFLQGVGFSVHPMLTALFSDTYGAGARRRFSRLSASEALGWGVGSLSAGALADQIGITSTLLVVGVFPLLSALVVWRRLPESVPESADATAGARARFPKRLVFLYSTVFVRMTAAVALWSVLPVYLKGFVQSLTLVGAVTSVNMLTQPLFMLAIGRFAEHVDRLKLVTIGILGSVLTFWVYAAAQDAWFIALAQLMIAASWSALFIGANTYVMGAAPQGTRGKAFGYLQGSITTAVAVGPMLGAPAADWLGIRTMILLASGLMVLSLPFLLRLRLVERREQLRPAD